MIERVDEYCIIFAEFQYPKANIKLIMNKVREKLRPIYKDFVAENMPKETRVISYESLR